jgi:formylglycine-generating enzyme required for sulfatase activity/tRNA A-37 threonylcarbamoyl transferase component Bud32
LAISKRDRVSVEVAKLRGKISEKAAGAALSRVQTDGISAIDALVAAKALDPVALKELQDELKKLTIRCSECGRDELLGPQEPVPSPKRCEACRQKERAKAQASGRVPAAPGTLPKTRTATGRFPAPEKTGPTSPPRVASQSQRLVRQDAGPPSKGASQRLGPPVEPAKPPAPAAPPPAPPKAPAPGDAAEEEDAVFATHSSSIEVPAKKKAEAPEPAPQDDDDEPAAFKSHSTDVRETAPNPTAPSAAAPSPAPGAPPAPSDDLAFSDEVGGKATSGPAADDPGARASQRLSKAKLEELKGAVIGDCTLEALIGRGAMGVVFSAHHKRLNRRVAIKILEPKLANDPKFVTRFFHEAQALALLDNPYVVRVFTSDKDDQGRYYAVMELLEGGTVQRVLKAKGKLEIDEAVQIVSEAAKGLHAAHRADLIHRDVKPANLMLTKEGHVKVVDFGLAVPTQGEVFLATEVVGTPIYMAPEQADGLSLDGRCDQYALGITLYQLVCGRPPFERKKPIDVITAHMSEAPPPPHELREDIPAWLQDVILKMLAKSPAERFATMAEVYQALDSRGVGVEAPSLERLRRPAITVDAGRIAQLGAGGVGAEEVKKPGWALALLVSAASIALAVTVVLMASKGADAKDNQRAVPRAIERTLAEARALTASGSERDLAAAMALLDDARALGPGPALPALADATKACEQKLAALRAEAKARLKERVARLLAKHRYGAAIDAARADAALVASLDLGGFLVELRGEAKEALERDQGEVYVPAGSFHSGAEGDLVPCGAFYVERTEVTNAAWSRAVEQKTVAPPSTWPQGKLPAGWGARPVTGITFDEADRYARSLGKRLPTSVEWEHAARGDEDARAWPWGNAFAAGKANLLDGGSGALEDVTARPGDASPFGVLGLAGNALEWVVGPGGPLVAGGGFGSDALAARVFTRVPLGAGEKDPALGFRCARDIEPGD